jgi:response regulator of citrate/malate metabolism
VTIDVLVIDDDFRVAEVHARYVAAQSGFRVVATAHTAEEALQAAADHRPDLALLDNYLPDAAGLDIAGKLGCDIFMVTADGSAGTVRAALRAGALTVILKPFGREVLSSRLEGYLRFRRRLPDGAGSLSQEAIDRALCALHPVERGTAAANRSSITAQLVADAVRTADNEVSAAVVSSRLGIARATAQRYLAALVTDGLAEMSLRYGSTGRPEHWYSWIGAAGDAG